MDTETPWLAVLALFVLSCGLLFTPAKLRERVLGPPKSRLWVRMIGLLGLIWLGLLYAERAKTEPTRSVYLRGAVIAKVRHYVGGVMIGLGVALATFKFERNGARENHHRHE